MVAGEFLGEGEQQRGAEHEPGQHLHESVRGGFQQEDGAGDAADDADEEKGNENAAADIESVAVGSAAGGGADPERETVGGIGGNGRDSGEEESGESDEAAAAGDGVERAPEDSGDEEHDGGVDWQVSRCIRNRAGCQGG